MQYANQPTFLKHFLSAFCLALMVASCAPEDQKETVSIEPPAPQGIEGSWEMKSIHWITKDTTYTIKEAQPGLFIFDSKRYSIMWTPIDTLRTPFKNLSNPEEKEIIAGFKSVVFNGGTYTKNDSSIVTKASIAKVPGFEGGQQFYQYEILNNQLELTMYDETYPDGSKPQWYGKYKTKFVMERAQ